MEFCYSRRVNLNDEKAFVVTRGKKTSTSFLSAISGSFLVLAICESFRGFHLLIALVWVLEIHISVSLGHGR